MVKIQKEIEELEAEGQSGGGLVSVLVNGKKKIVSINIDSDALQEDKDILEDLILSATNQALDSIDKISKEKMAPLQVVLTFRRYNELSRNFIICY